VGFCEIVELFRLEICGFRLHSGTMWVLMVEFCMSSGSVSILLQYVDVDCRIYYYYFKFFD
jgi:hypothetical protein